MRSGFIRWTTLLTLVLCGLCYAGPDWTEPPGMDAGSDPASAQLPSGSGPLHTIRGSTSAVLRSPEAVPDFEDVYRIRICDPTLFCAKTTANFDTQVWLFDENGFGILGNDNGNGDQGVVFPPATDQTKARPHLPGVYLIAVSGFNRDPVGQSPIPAEGGLIFFQETRTERSGPDGPGGQAPLVAWVDADTGAPSETGEYILRLEGITFVEDNCTTGNYVERPCIPTVGEWGLVAIFFCLLIGGVMVMKRRGQESSELSS